MEISGYIHKIYEPEFEIDKREYQNVIIRTTNNEKFLLTVNLYDYPIDFVLNTPITIKGNIYNHPTGLLSITDTRDPIGYVRYNGKVYQ